MVHLPLGPVTYGDMIGSPFVIFFPALTDKLRSAIDRLAANAKSEAPANDGKPTTHRRIL
jgi:hypothetical protein